MEVRSEIAALRSPGMGSELDSAPPSNDEILRRRPVYTLSLLLIAGMLMVFGAFNLYSASGGDALFYAHMKHVAIACTGFVLVALFARPRHLNTSAYWFYGTVCILLIAVLVIGQIGGGSRRWLTIGGFNGQPSEIAKIAVAIVVARFFSEVKGNAAYRLKDLWPLALLVGFMSVLIFPQPDLGTASFLMLIAATQMCFVKIDLRSVMILGGTATVTLPLGWHFLLLDYQKTRILSFLDPSFEPQGKGYNVLQSLIAIGSGGAYGKGFMNGTQTHLKFLPMSHSDFIFSVFAEEHGFVGGSIVILSFAALAYIALQIARESKTIFNALLATGLGAFLFIEFAINVAMVLRMFPVKGLPLPFMSFGGSNLLTACIAVAMLIAVDRDNRGRFRSRQIQLYR